jgi:hypothetical protein
MALKKHSTAELFDAVKARLVAASGSDYDERMGVGQFPTGRRAHFCIGPLSLRWSEKERAQAGDTVEAVVDFPVEFAELHAPAQRETRRKAVFAKMDAIRQGATANTAGLETRWLRDTESEASSGEWLVYKGVLRARCLMAVTA